MQRTNEYLSELSLDLYISYYLFQKNYTKAVTLYDSLIVATKERGNLYEYKNALLSKGALLHILEDLQQAAVLYHEVKELNRSLDSERIADALVSIRSTYLADRMNLVNA